MPSRTPIIFLIICLAVVLLSPVTVSAGPAVPMDAALNIPFGGRIISRSWQVCLIPVPPPVFFIPIPFIYLVIGEPRSGAFYYWFGISKRYRRDGLSAMVPTAWVLGIANEILKEAITLPCANKAFLPPAEGVITKIGTSCPYEQYDECEVR